MLALLEMTSVKNQKNMAEIDRLMRDKHQLQYQLREVVSGSLNTHACILLFTPLFFWGTGWNQLCSVSVW